LEKKKGKQTPFSVKGRFHQLCKADRGKKSGEKAEEN